MRFDVAAALETLESGPPRMRVGGSWASLTPGPVLSGQDDQTTYRAIIPGEVSRLNEQLGVIRLAPSAAVRQRAARCVERKDGGGSTSGSPRTASEQP